MFERSLLPQDPMLTSENPENLVVASEGGWRRTLLAARGLRMAFDGQTVLDGADLRIEEGEVVLLRGENGSGKTTLLNILAGNLEPDEGVIEYLADDSPRAYRFPRPALANLNPLDHFAPEYVAREGIARTWQDVRLFGSLSVLDNVVVSASDHRGERPLAALLRPRAVERQEAAARAEAREILERLGLSSRADSSSDRISLGQSKRVAVARAVMRKSRVILLDEPFAGLDHPGAEEILQILGSLVAEFKATLVIVEHVSNHQRLRPLVSTDWILENGKIHRSDPRRNLIPPARGGNSGLEAPTVSLLSSPHDRVENETLPRGGLLTRLSAEKSTNARVPLLELRDLVVRRGSRLVIGASESAEEAGLDLILHSGELAILQAPNGWGKTTLQLAIAGVIAPERGQILLNGIDVTALHPFERTRLGLSVLLSMRPAFSELRTREVLRLAHGKGVEVPFLPAHLLDRKMSTLSGGEAQLAMMAAVKPGLVTLLDEPFAALDVQNIEKVRSLPMIRDRVGRSLLVLCPREIPLGAPADELGMALAPAGEA